MTAAKVAARHQTARCSALYNLVRATNYASGGEGAEEANGLIARDGRARLLIAGNNCRTEPGA